MPAPGHASPQTQKSRRGDGGVSSSNDITSTLTGIAISDFIGHIKAGSSKWHNGKNTKSDHFEWQAGYGAFSVSESQASKVRKYIQTQEAHHAKVSFKDELISLLKKHGIEYDERYLLG